MPAQSPTLSPTLSAITAGLRGSSSGMPASTLPTRSAPTSAPFVKMPPPRRAKIEISEPPNSRKDRDQRAAEREADQGLEDRGLLHAHRVQDRVVTGDAREDQADDEET